MMHDMFCCVQFGNIHRQVDLPFPTAHLIDANDMHRRARSMLSLIHYGPLHDARHTLPHPIPPSASVPGIDLCASSAFCVSALNSHPSNCNPIRRHSNISEPFLSVFNHLQIFTPDSPKSSRYPQGGTSFSLSTRTSHRNPMSTLRQIEANQRNAQKSTGPTSVTDRKSTRLNSSHLGISYAVFCLKKTR